MYSPISSLKQSSLKINYNREEENNSEHNRRTSREPSEKILIRQKRNEKSLHVAGIIQIIAFKVVASQFARQRREERKKLFNIKKIF